MKYLNLKTKDPYYNLAVEEYFFKNLQDDLCMIWQNQPTVVIGKNQNAYAEVHLDYATEKGIKISRRITGGGAVYHDLGNVNYTFISKSKNKEIDFAFFTAPIIELLADLGVNAMLSGRNDLVVEGKKISGNAQFINKDGILHHGTLLFDSELSVIESVLRVDPEKIKAKALPSVSSRVTNIRSLLKNDMDSQGFISEIESYIIKRFGAEVIDAPEFPLIEDLYNRNCSEEWIFSSRRFLIEYDLKRKKKYPFGLVCTDLRMVGEAIDDIKIFGDFFGKDNIEELEDIIRGLNIKTLKNTLKTVKVENYIYGMTNEQLLDLVLDE